MAQEPVTPMTLINNFLRQLNYTGYNPKNRTLFEIIFGFILWLAMFSIFCLEFVFLITNSYMDLSSFVINMISLATMWQFWSLDNLPHFQRAAIQVIYNFAKLAYNGYTLAMFTALICFYTITYFQDKENLIVNIWMPDSIREWNRNPFGHHLLFGIEGIFLTLVTIGAVTVLDGLFVVFIALAITQLKMLKYKLLAINGKRSAEITNQEIIECIKHHNLLLEFLKKIEKVFSTPLLHVVGTDMTGVVLCMYSSMMESDMIQIISFGSICIVGCIQLFMYCVIGQYIQDETESIAEAAYMCKWEDIPDNNIRRSLLLMILRAQRPVYFTMGGAFTLSLETFTDVSKMMYTLLTFMMNFDVGK